MLHAKQCCMQSNAACNAESIVLYMGIPVYGSASHVCEVYPHIWVYPRIWGIPPHGGTHPYGGIPRYGGIPPYGGKPSIGGYPPYGGTPPYGGGCMCISMWGYILHNRGMTHMGIYLHMGVYLRRGGIPQYWGIPPPYGDIHWLQWGANFCHKH